MKTATLTLNRKVLVIEFPEIPTEIKQNGEFLFYKTESSGNLNKGAIQVGYKKLSLLGSPDDLKEEDVKDVVEPPIPKWDVDKVYYLDYRYEGYYDLKFAIDSFNSALEENEIYWVNPIAIIPRGEAPEHERVENQNKFYEAETRTFDRTRTLIFVEN